MGKNHVNKRTYSWGDLPKEYYRPYARKVRLLMFMQLAFNLVSTGWLISAEVTGMSWGWILAWALSIFVTWIAVVRFVELYRDAALAKWRLDMEMLDRQKEAEEITWIAMPMAK